MHSMHIGDIAFLGFVMNSSGVLEFFGDGYPYHRYLPWSLADWSNSTFVAKTTTLMPREGFMPMAEDGVTPREFVPRCIIVKPWGGHVLNAVGLSGPGAPALVAVGKWQARIEPFVISFMAVGKERNDRMQEWLGFLSVIAGACKDFHSRFAIEINVSCPNVGLDQAELADEIEQMLDIGERLGVPLIVNVNLLFPPKLAASISRHKNCAAVSQSNSVPWGAFPERIPWKRLFGSMTSPLEKRGFAAGGYSGPYALPILLNWIRDARYAYEGKRWLIAGGGIQSPDDAEVVMRTGFPILHGIK
ncbi:MAG: hypothetical protein WA001_00675, partial [Patescibacteria group bacterium]